MKAKLFDSSGKEKAEIEMPSVFASKVREDLSWKLFEVDKMQSMLWYSNNPEAGKRHSASGTISHKRHEWKGHYGKGIARLPRKTMWRRGTQFYWIGAEVASARGGRRVHGPSGIRTPVKMNRKETEVAFNSALAATASNQFVSRRYSSLSGSSMKAVPFVIESVPSKTKEAIESFRKILGDLFSLALKKKEVRSGKGKQRGRKYKSNAGLLLVIGNKEAVNFSGIEVVNAKDLSISSLYPLGRLTIYTKQALADLGDKK